MRYYFKTNVIDEVYGCAAFYSQNQVYVNVQKPRKMLAQ